VDDECEITEDGGAMHVQVVIIDHVRSWVCVCSAGFSVRRTDMFRAIKIFASRSRRMKQTLVLISSESDEADGYSY